MADYYVAKDGVDTNDGSELTPWLTIQKAADTLVAGDTVFIKEGIYNEQVIPANSGTDGNLITYRGYGEFTIIDGTGIGTETVGTTVGLFNIHNKSFIVVDSLTIKNSLMNGISVYESCDNIQLNNLYITLIYESALFISSTYNSANNYPTNIYIENVSSYLTNRSYNSEAFHLFNVIGLYAYGCSINNTVYDQQTSREWECQSGVGIYGCQEGYVAECDINHVMNGISINSSAYQSCMDLEIYNNSIYNCGGANSGVGILINSELSPYLQIINISIYNNIVYNNYYGFIAESLPHSFYKTFNLLNNVFYHNGHFSEISIKDSNMTDVYVRNNIIVGQYSTTVLLSYTSYPTNITVSNNLFFDYAGYNVNNIYGDNSVIANPQFTDEVNYLFSVKSSSPAIDAGSDVISFNFDFAGNNRVRGYHCDIGAYEYDVEAGTGHSITSEMANQVKIPLIKATITKFADGVKPGVKTGGTKYIVDVLNFSCTFGYDQGSATATLTIRSPFDDDGVSYTYFEPFNRIEVQIGYNNYESCGTVFLGFIDTIDLNTKDKTQTMTCRDIVKLALDNYLTTVNRKLYCSSTIYDEDTYMGGQPPEERTIQAIMTDLLVDSGIPEDWFYHDFAEYPDTGCVVFGNINSLKFKFISAFDACRQLADELGEHLWADPWGRIRCKLITPVAANTPAISYSVQREVYDPIKDDYIITNDGQIVDIDAKVSDEYLRNYIRVYGYNSMYHDFVGASDFIPEPPTYYRAEVSDPNLDTYELIDAVGTRMLNELNRIRYTADVTIEGDPRLEIGMTIGIADDFSFGTETDPLFRIYHPTDIRARNYFLYGYTHNFTPGNFRTTMNLVGGIGVGSEAVSNVSPTAIFTYSRELEHILGSNIVDIKVDASKSYDSDGPVEDLTYQWVCSGFEDVTGVSHTYVTEGSGYLVVTLTVTDKGLPIPLSSSITQAIPLSPTNEEQINYKSIYLANAGHVISSTNGGIDWIDTGVV
jgi:hypothetical protein